MRRYDLLNINRHDVDLLIENFQTIQNDDHLFYFSYVTNENGMSLFYMLSYVICTYILLIMCLFVKILLCPLTQVL